MVRRAHIDNVNYNYSKLDVQPVIVDFLFIRLTNVLSLYYLYVSLFLSPFLYHE